LSYPASVFSAAETQHEAKLRNEAVRMSMSLFARYVRAMQGGEKNGVSEIRNARHLAQLWFAHAGTHLSYLPPGRVDRINKLMHAYVDKRIEELENYYTP